MIRKIPGASEKDQVVNREVRTDITLDDRLVHQVINPIKPLPYPLPNGEWALDLSSHQVLNRYTKTKGIEADISPAQCLPHSISCRSRLLQPFVTRRTSTTMRASVDTHIRNIFKLYSGSSFQSNQTRQSPQCRPIINRQSKVGGWGTYLKVPGSVVLSLRTER